MSLDGSALTILRSDAGSWRPITKHTRYSVRVKTSCDIRPGHEGGVAVSGSETDANPEFRSQREATDEVLILAVIFRLAVVKEEYADARDAFYRRK